MNNDKEMLEAAKLLARTIEKFTNRKAIVFYCAIGDDIESGITLGDDIVSEDLERACFILTGRAFQMIDYNSPDKKINL